MQIPESNPTSGFARHTILVAEDNPNNYKLVEVILRNTYTLLHTENGEEAIALYREFKPDGCQHAAIGRIWSSGDDPRRTP